MLIKVADPAFQTILFSVIFLCLMLISFRRLRSNNFFSKEVTNQLKGLAIFAVVFSHISLFLFYEPKFLYPYNVLAGVGVNLFLFLSGFGLTVSYLKSPLSPVDFYKKRLSKLFIPLWIVITAVLLIDFLALGRTYPLSEIIHAFLGFYPRADVSINLDSPLWYFSLIFFYYLLFPLTFFKKIPLLSPFLVLCVTLLVLNLKLPVHPDVIKLYKLHTLAFPLGMLFGLTVQKINLKLNSALKLLALLMALFVFLYTALHSGVGEDPKIEQTISLITTLSLVVIFSLSKFDFKLLSLFGIYSYEIYLLHWPVLSRFNLFSGLPPFLVVTLNLGLIFLLGYGIQKVVTKLTTQFYRLRAHR
ncbi:hypothetical protein A2967_02070 [Candidatus Daviesbacteria bacterium RIFCSPLOWO2_01_FULL_41_32]|uniref:Acyltransferase 3 domain-containing protein n=1 Tax=Candidatus Daviesbacteria bacterium RIFCSPHIGHO2_01_FULL_41_23 TaxID=1797764 RepID=A0A1F5IQR4_9BACT|nr:MAG: hypothetical protein A2871_04405 [Candidatus Daviesbacteria bacterium RIFCSPHIGHO2_01_FULL_41_23]OGE62227.1 MAG: hypothetical protein A2967_02070 [Candidatus Daviesbacteria bacterium RIFCSPLOWO2_01_FULL_41_32]